MGGHRGNLAATSFKRSAAREGYTEVAWGSNGPVCSGAHSSSNVLLPFREAESFKEQGNAYYAKKDYNEAYNYYTKAIGESGL